jgi:hypothetical protein
VQHFVFTAAANTSPMFLQHWTALESPEGASGKYCT